jgi:hypothetical protein
MRCRLVLKRGQKKVGKFWTSWLRTNNFSSPQKLLCASQLMMEGKYVYSSLKTLTSIRLLVFDNPANSKKGIIRIRLIEADISDENVKYEALSYTWGDMKDTVSIEIGLNSYTAITRPLDQFLRSLSQHVDSNSNQLYFWADQICINQSDIDERNQQVALMGEIYIRSQRTLVWLGEPNSNIIPATRLLQKIDELGFNRQARIPSVIETVQSIILQHLDQIAGM